MPPYSDFSRRANEAMGAAFAAAKTLQAPEIGTEHILYGLIDNQTNGAYWVLDYLEVDLANIRSYIHRRKKTLDPSHLSTLTLSLGSRQVIDASRAEAHRMNQTLVCTEHLLMGIFSFPNGVAALALKDQDVTIEEVREAVVKFRAQR